MKQRTRTIYEKRTTPELRTLLSKKKLRYQKIEPFDSFFFKQEKELLLKQIAKIEVELTSRFYQQELPL